MVLKADQLRVKALLTETITLLCKNGLNYRSEFAIEALIGITLDQDDVFLISIKEKFGEALDAINASDVSVTDENRDFEIDFATSKPSPVHDDEIEQANICEIVSQIPVTPRRPSKDTHVGGSLSDSTTSVILRDSHQHLPTTSAILKDSNVDKTVTDYEQDQSRDTASRIPPLDDSSVDIKVKIERIDDDDVMFKEESLVCHTMSDDIVPQIFANISSTSVSAIDERLSQSYSATSTQDRLSDRLAVPASQSFNSPSTSGAQQTMANKKRVKSDAEKESDRLRSQRYRDEHSKDPEYRAKRAKKAREDRSTAGPVIYSPATMALKADNLRAWRKRKKEEKAAAATMNAASGRHTVREIVGPAARHGHPFNT